MVRLANELIQVDVVPALGGKILHLLHKRLARQFLWRNPHLSLRQLRLGADYDDNFFGGFDEQLPNDIPELVDGRGLIDHGEVWLTPLTATVQHDGLVLEARLPITPLHYRKMITLAEGAARLELSYRIENCGSDDVRFLWKMHPALRVSEGCEIRVPAGKAINADPEFARFGHLASFAWPTAADESGQPIRADLVPRMGKSTEFLYLTDLRAGTAGLAHRQENWLFEMTFCRDVFRCVWVFASYGGWRGHEVLVLEPSTTWPLSLNEAIDSGRHVCLAPGQILSAALTVAVGLYRPPSAAAALADQA